jgi:hypothetical protein
MEKKKFLFDSLSGLIGDIAWQVSKEGLLRICNTLSPVLCVRFLHGEPMGSHGEKPNASDGSPQPQASPRVSRSFPKSNPLSLDRGEFYPQLEVCFHEICYNLDCY